MNNLTNAIVLLLSIQALLLLMKAFSFFAAQPAFVYLAFWLVFFIAGQIIAAVLYSSRKRSEQQERGLRAFLAVEAILTFFLLSALVKTIFYDYRSVMAQRAFNVLLILAVLNKFFWPNIRQAGRRVHALISARANTKILKQLILALGSVFLVLIIFVPNFQRVLARMYIGEQFHHLDIFVMTAGWAAYNGHIMDVDQISQYGVGMPFIFAQLTRWMGGFT